MADYGSSAASGAAAGASVGGPWGALIGAGLGLVKGKFDQDREKRDRQVQAQTTRFSPWTHMQAGPVQAADMMGAVMQGGSTGAALGQGFDKMRMDDSYRQAQMDALKQQGSAGSYGSGWMGMYPGGAQYPARP